MAGDLQYHDHGFFVKGAGKKGTHLAVHMDIGDVFPDPIPETCEIIDEEIWSSFGGQPDGVEGRIAEYCPQPLGDPSECGQALLVVLDTGEPGPNKGDMLFINLIDGKFGGYVVNGGELQGGNISIGIP